MGRAFCTWGFAFGLTAILLGAFGAHGLKSILNETQLSSFETGVRYQIYHAFFLIIIGTNQVFQSKVVLILTVMGIFLFSGSIYLLNLKEFFHMPFLKFLGPITPIGGLLLISSWLILLLKTIQKK